LIGWGYSGRKAAEPYFDPDLWARQISCVVDHVAPKGPVGVLGHSLGGFVALLAAARDRRIDHALANGAMGVHYPSNDVMEAGWKYPDNIEASRALYERILTVQSQATRQRLIEDRMEMMTAPGYREYFTRMFSGTAQQYIDQAVLTAADLSNIHACVLLIYGKDDTAVPFFTAGLGLAEAIAHADILRIAGSGHATMIDAPQKLCKIARAFFPKTESEKGDTNS
jgi:2-hydroxymuconate-semialdehyde hydrolase